MNFRPHAEAGNVLVLTKPLGTQVAVNARQWKDQNTERYKRLINSKLVTPEDIERAYQEASYNMAHLNKQGMCLIWPVIYLPNTVQTICTLYVTIVHRRYQKRDMLKKLAVGCQSLLSFEKRKTVMNINIVQRCN